MRYVDAQGRIKYVLRSVQEGNRKIRVLILRLRSGDEVALATPWADEVTAVWWDGVSSSTTPPLQNLVDQIVHRLPPGGHNFLPERAMRVNIDDTHFDDVLGCFYKGNPLTGETVETDADGNFIELTTFWNGIEEGPQLAGYSDGSRKYESILSNGHLVGVARKWYRNDQLQEDGSLATEQQVGA